MARTRGRVGKGFPGSPISSRSRSESCPRNNSANKEGFLSRNREPFCYYKSMIREGLFSIAVILVIVVIAIIAIGIFYYNHSSLTISPSPSQNNSSTIAQQTVHTGWQIYKNSKLGFSIMVPNSWIIPSGNDSDPRLCPNTSCLGGFEIKFAPFLNDASGAQAITQAEQGAMQKVELGNLLPGAKVIKYQIAYPGPGWGYEYDIYFANQNKWIVVYTDNLNIDQVIATLNISPFYTQVNSSWKQVYVSSTKLKFSMPDFGVPYNIHAATSTEGSLISVQLENTSSFYVTEFLLYVYNNPMKLNLHDWFEENVDDEGVLLAQNGYKQETLPSGSSAYVFVSSAPLFTIPGFEGYGPGTLLTAFTQSATTGEIIGVDGSQAGDLYDYGFITQDSEIQLQLSILGTAHF